MRLRNEGPDADVVIALDDLEVSAKTACILDGFRDDSLRGKVVVQSAFGGAGGSDAPAIALRMDRGLLLAGPAQVDALLRIVRDGQDERRIEPVAQGLVSIEATIEHSRISAAIRNKAPVVFAATKGLEHAKVTIEIGGSVHVKGEFSYGSETAAKDAGKLLTKVREAIMTSDRSEYREAARSSHANLTDSTIRLRFDLPR
jgi:hypothetical protein